MLIYIELQNKEEITVLNLQKIVDEGSLIVEWPEIMGSSISANILTLILKFMITQSKLVKDGVVGKIEIRYIL